MSAPLASLPPWLVELGVTAHDIGAARVTDCGQPWLTVEELTDHVRQHRGAGQDHPHLYLPARHGVGRDACSTRMRLCWSGPGCRHTPPRRSEVGPGNPVVAGLAADLRAQDQAVTRRRTLGTSENPRETPERIAAAQGHCAALRAEARKGRADESACKAGAWVPPPPRLRVSTPKGGARTRKWWGDVARTRRHPSATHDGARGRSSRPPELDEARRASRSPGPLPR